MSPDMESSKLTHKERLVFLVALYVLTSEGGTIVICTLKMGKPKLRKVDNLPEGRPASQRPRWDLEPTWSGARPLLLTTRLCASQYWSTAAVSHSQVTERMLITGYLRLEIKGYSHPHFNMPFVCLFV